MRTIPLLLILAALVAAPSAHAISYFDQAIQNAHVDGSGLPGEQNAVHLAKQPLDDQPRGVLAMARAAQGVSVAEATTTLSVSPCGVELIQAEPSSTATKEIQP